VSPLKRRLLAAYLILLALSFAVRLGRAKAPVLGPQDRQLEVREVDGDRLLNRPVRLVYREAGGEEAAASRLPVLLLHGSPGSKLDFLQVQPALAERRYRSLAPDLPGFGASSQNIADYSFHAHARYVVQLLDQLAIPQVHVVGFSMGGGVALELAQLAPERVASISMVSAIGVQEHELLGNFHLNHIVHGLQLAGLWLLREGTPHMGALDGAFLGVPYARNFFDSDQRPLRGVLQAWNGPLLIVHGRNDVLVPVAAALEHARLVPQSELMLSDENHFFVFQRGAKLANTLAGFFQRVEAGQALHRQEADPQRIARSLEPFDGRDLPPFHGFALVLLLLSLGAATLVSEDLTCIGAGLLVASGRLHFWAAVAACLVGIFVGDLMLYAVGRFLGRPALRRRPLSWFLRAEDVDRSSHWFDRRGPALILLTRFLPGTRLPTYFAAGLFGTRFWTFTFFFLLAGALWTPALVGLSAGLGNAAAGVLGSLQRAAWLGVLGLVLLIFLSTKILLPALTHRGRRLLRGKIRRWRRWEYWPPWLFYPPVVLWVLWLGLRFRGLTAFTAANPGIEAGGFIGESKYRILRGLGEDEARIARFELLAAEVEPTKRAARWARAMTFVEQQGLSFPLVLKPDAGQRGADVHIVPDAEALRQHLETDGRAWILQEYVAGLEFGLFYVRKPSEARGRIFSITEKHFPEVAGDGQRSLEELILADPKLLAMAPHYLQVQAAHLEEVPAAGERLRLVELGTHCRGSVFLDGGRLRTPALEEALDSLSRPFEGFFFGRYDVRVPSQEELKLGRGFKVLELNGVTSEATHIYDPANSLLSAYRVLFRQWRLAFEIGRENLDRGAKATSAKELLAAVFQYRWQRGSAVELDDEAL
jgi:pimeloyl-ACP methyl ester carboxylesterase/membrane protein DedA with SNARE-associated domain